jgi:hypothetical protein
MCPVNFWTHKMGVLSPIPGEMVDIR